MPGLSAKAGEFLRFGLNGAFATGVHFAVLTFNLQVLMIPSAGLANLLAAVVGVSVSFLGNRYFVFGSQGSSLFKQAAQFVVLYGLLAVMQGGILALWTDLWHLDYRTGFCLAIACQVALSFVINKKVVFRK